MSLFSNDDYAKLIETLIRIIAKDYISYGFDTKGFIRHAEESIYEMTGNVPNIRIDSDPVQFGYDIRVQSKNPLTKENILCLVRVE